MRLKNLDLIVTMIIAGLNVLCALLPSRIPVIGIILTLPVVILSMFFMSRFPGKNYLLLALATPVWAIVGWEFHRGAIKTLRLPL